MSSRLLLARALLASALVAAGVPVVAQERDAPPGEGKVARANAGPLVVGKSRLQEAEALWRETGARPGQRGNLAIGFGSGADRFGKIGLDQVLLVDVEGVDFEGLTAARYAFVDDVLYSVQVSLGLDVSRQKSVASNELPKEEFAALEARLRKEHGKPSRELRDLFAPGRKGPNILVWRVGANELTLANSLKKFLRLENPALAKKVDAYRKAACKQHNLSSKVRDCW